MLFSPPLQKATLIKRYKRFLADVQLDDAVITVHCANTGPMTGLTEPGTPVWIQHRPGKGKLGYSWEIAQDGKTLIGTNTRTPNILVRQALDDRFFPFIQGYEQVYAEVQCPDVLSTTPIPIQETRHKVPKSRIDFRVDGPDGSTYIEVKNVHMKRGEGAFFPDAMTTRGQRHLEELDTIAQNGTRAIMLYIIQRDDCSYFSIAKDIDPIYGKLFKQATQRTPGVEAFAWSCQVSPFSITLFHQIPLQ